MEKEARFRGIAVVVRAAADSFKSKFAIKGEGCGVGFADFQKNLASTALLREMEELFQKETGITFAAMSGGYCDVQDFCLFAQMPPLQHGYNFAIEFTNECRANHR